MPRLQPHCITIYGESLSRWHLWSHSQHRLTLHNYRPSSDPPAAPTQRPTDRCMDWLVGGQWVGGTFSVTAEFCLTTFSVLSLCAWLPDAAEMYPVRQLSLLDAPPTHKHDNWAGRHLQQPQPKFCCSRRSKYINNTSCHVLIACNRLWRRHAGYTGCRRF